MKDITNTTDDIVKIIETWFFEASGVDYNRFWLQIETINAFEIDEIREHDLHDIDIDRWIERKRLQFKSEIKCDERFCENILDDYDNRLQQRILEQHIQNNTRDYFEFRVITDTITNAERHSSATHSRITFSFLTDLSKAKVYDLDPNPWSNLFPVDWKDTTFIYNLAFVLLCIGYIICIVCIVSRHNKSYYRLVIWCSYCWLYANSVYYWRHSSLIYIMNVLHLLYIYCKYYRSDNTYLHYINVGISAQTQATKKLSKEVLLSQTNIFIFFSIIGGVPASIQLTKSRIYRSHMFSVSIADRFWMLLFKDVGFIFLLFIYYAVLLMPSGGILIYEPDDQKDWNMVSILLGTIIVFCHIIYLIYKFRFKHKYTPNHGVLQINAQFEDELIRKHIFKTIHKNYEKQLTKMIQTHLDLSSKFEYFVEVIDVDTDDTNHALIISLFVAWNSMDDTYNVKFSEHIQMEINFREQLITDIKFAEQIAKFCVARNEDEPPQISIKGTYTREDLHSYQLKEFERKNNKILDDLKRNIYDEIKPLYKMTNEDVCNIIKYWILSDVKYRLYNKDVMKIIRDKNINGIVIQELSKKGMNVKLYLTDLIGNYYEDKMIEIIANALVSHKGKTTIDSYKLAEIICTFRIHRIDETLNNDDTCDGLWFMNKKNAKRIFINKLKRNLAINNDDAIQIYKLLQTFNIPKNDDFESQILDSINKSELHKHIKIHNIKELSSDVYPINYEQIALKLKNNLSLQTESEIIMNLFWHLITVNKIKDKANYSLMDNLYHLYSAVFGAMCLDEWWCSECCYHNRSIRLGGKFLTRKDKLMMMCIVCSTEKRNAIINALKGESKQKYLFESTSNRAITENNDLDCDGYIQNCKASTQISQFLQQYEEHELDYPSILSELSSSEVEKQIFLPAILQIKNDVEKEILLQTYCNFHLFNNDSNDEVMLRKGQKIDGKLLCELEEEAFQIDMVLKQNISVSAGTIKHLYDLIYKECDKYVNAKRKEMFGSSCSELMDYWKHCLTKHMNFYNEDCKQNLFNCTNKIDLILEDDDIDNEEKYVDECKDCKHKLNKCNDPRCVAMTRNIDRFKQINIKSKATKSKARDTLYGDHRINITNIKYNHHIQRQNQNDRYFQYELDSIHTHLLHDHHHSFEIDLAMAKKQSRKRESTKVSIILQEIELTALHSQNEQFEANKDKYTTDIGLYGFGVDHRHQYLSPSKVNGSMRDEMMDSGYVTTSAWNDVSNKAFNKIGQIMFDTKFVSKQFSNDYNINRGDTIGVHHIMAICFYTDFSYLCSDFRSTFRRTEQDTNDDDVRVRHSRYYFFSRFLYVAIEFFGDIMQREQKVYHGLDKAFLFKDFLTHFNAPTSTTPDWHCAVNFAKENGIILALINGNESICDIPSTISQFTSDQPRYMDVSWISAFQNEREYLFYGDNIIFKIHDVIHKEVPKNTLKQLNLLQRIIENKSIIWEKEPQSRIKLLCDKLAETREMNLKRLNNDDNDDEMKDIDDLEEKLFKTTSHNQFMQFATKALNESDKWKEKDKMEVIKAFEDYCTLNEMDGQIFKELSRKLLFKWMESNYSIIMGRSAKMYNVLKKEIAFYDKKIMDSIEAIEKDKTEKYNVDYYLKLFYYFIVSRFDFICIRSLYNIPQNIQNALFSAYNDRINTISLTRLTDLFNNVNNMAFTQLSYDEMIRNSSSFCKSVIYYAKDMQNSNKRLKFILFKSVNLTNSKYSIMLKKCVQKYQSQTSNISIRYSFKWKMNHILTFEIQSIGERLSTNRALVKSISLYNVQNDTGIERADTTFTIRSNTMMSDETDYLFSSDDNYDDELKVKKVSFHIETNHHHETKEEEEGD